MLSRLAPAALAAALTCTLGGTPALANTTPKSDKSGPAATRPAAPAEAGKETRPAGKLKAEMLELVADARAGEAAPAAPRWGQQPAMSHGLSKGQKIAIGVGVAAVVVVAIVVATKANDAPGDIRIF